MRRRGGRVSLPAVAEKHRAQGGHGQSAEGRDQATDDMEEAGARQQTRGPAGDQSARALPCPRPCPTIPHLFPGDLTQAGVCVLSGDVIPSAVRPATEMEG